MVKVLLVAIIASTGLFFVVMPDYEEAEYDPVSKPSPEAPWLSRTAALQIVGPEGSLGPLFDGLWLGGSAPSPDARARIAKFARENRVQIDLDTVGDELVAIRFDVVFGGCCGYEGADALALRLARPHTQACCGCPREWVDDWAVTNTSTMRARIRVNRAMFRWERTLTMAEVIERADGLLGKRAAAIKRTAGDRWREIEPGARYLLEMPYPFIRHAEMIAGSGFAHRDDLGVMVHVEHGTIVDVTIKIRDHDRDEVTDDLKARWGKWPRRRDDVRTWEKPDRVVTADFGWDSKITIAKR